MHINCFWLLLLLIALCFIIPCFASTSQDVSNLMSDNGGFSSKIPCWTYPLLLFGLTFILGIFAVLGGIGGGVLFVPIVSAFFPFHIDFVRGTGLLMVLAGSLTAGVKLLKKNLANLRLAMPLALISSICSIIGAIIGLSIPVNAIQILLGVTILFVVAIMLITKKSDFPNVKTPDALSKILGIMGTYHEESLGKNVEWHIHNTPMGFIIFAIIGLTGGILGLGAGWANVPVLNLLMGVPLKIAAATSNFILSVSDTSAAWIYLHHGAVLPIIVVPSLLGIMAGSQIGVKILTKTKPAIIRRIVISIMLFAGIRILFKGFKYIN